MAEATKETWITEQLSARGEANTPANRKRLGQQWDTRYGVKKNATWKEYFTKQFPQFASMFDGGEGEDKARTMFGNDLIDLFIDVATNPDNYDLTSEAGLNAFDGKLMATKYYQETGDKQRKWDLETTGNKTSLINLTRPKIASRYAALNLSKDQIDSITTYVLRNGMDDFTTDQYVYSLSAEMGKSLAGAIPEAEDMRKIARSYGYRPTDLEDMIAASATGKAYGPSGETITQDTLRNKAKNYAKALYPHLMQQIDAGMTLADVFEPYKDRAAQILEKPVTAFDMNDPLFMRALKADEKGQQMSMGEWERTIKSDAKYGYQYTQEANDIAQSMGLYIARAFGKIKTSTT